MKRLAMISLGLVGVLMISGCSHKEGGIEPSGYKHELHDAPAWVLKPDSNQTISASAGAPITEMGLQFAINEAENAARVSIAKQIEIKVSAMDETFKRLTGEKNNRSAESVKSEVFRIITHQSLTGVVRNDLWLSPSGEVWVLMQMRPETIAGIKETLKSGYKNASAQYQQEEMKKALAEMDAQIDTIEQH